MATKSAIVIIFSKSAEMVAMATDIFVPFANVTPIVFFEAKKPYCHKKTGYINQVLISLLVFSSLNILFT